MTPRPLCERCVDSVYPNPNCRACDELAAEYALLGLEDGKFCGAMDNEAWKY